MLSSVSMHFHNDKDKKIHRDSNIELLRMLSIWGVIILHYNNQTIGGGLQYVQEGTLNEALLLGLQGLCICAVDLFVLISGYFSCVSNKRSLVKIVGLLVQYSFFQMIRYIIEAIIDGSFSWYAMLRAGIPVNYFVILYVSLYIISPYINLILRSLSETQVKKMVGLLFGLFAVYPTGVLLVEEIVGPLYGLSSIGISGNDSGYTIINFILMYIIGAGIKMTNFTVEKRYAAIVLIIDIVVLGIWGKFNSNVAWIYCNPIVIINAIMLFLLFRQIQLRSDFINELSKASFTCFCVHLFFLDRCNIQRVVQLNALYMLGHIVITCLAIYIASYFIYKIWNMISKPLFIMLEKLFKQIDFDFSIKEQ